MKQDNITKSFREVIKTLVNPVLLPLGFVKQGQIYRRQLSDLWWIIQLQRQTFTSKYRILFPHGVYIPGFFPRFAGQKEPERPEISHCVFQMSASGVDLRVVPTDGEDSGIVEIDNSIQQEIHVKLNTAIMRLQAFPSIKEVLDYFEKAIHQGEWGPGHFWPNKPLARVYLGILYWLSGNQTRSLECFERSLQESTNPGFAETVARVRDRTVNSDVLRTK